MLRVERKCANARPNDDGIVGASTWNVSPLLAGDKVVISSRVQSIDSQRPYGTPSSSDTRSYLRVASDGNLQYVSDRNNATVFSILSQTGERDPLRERNEIQLHAETNQGSSPDGFVYLTSDGKKLSVFSDTPDRSIASRIRLVPSLVTEERIKRGFRKSELASPFIFTPDENLDRFTQDEGPLVRYGDIVVFRAPSLEFDNNYQYITCSGTNCSIVQANASATGVQDVAQFFSFQCPSGGIMYARTVPTTAIPPLQSTNPFLNPNYTSGVSDIVANDDNSSADAPAVQTEDSPTGPLAPSVTATEGKAGKENRSQEDKNTEVVEDPSASVVAAVQEKVDTAVATDRPAPKESAEEEQPWYEQPLGLAAIALLALAIVALLVWAIVKVAGTSGASTSIQKGGNSGGTRAVSQTTP